MSQSGDRFVPKVHPATRDATPDDPYTLRADCAPGDPEVMLRCVVQEYAWMGWDAEGILALFRNPFYPALQALFDLYGEAGVCQRVADVLGGEAFFRVREVITDPAEESGHQEDIIELGMPAGWRREATGNPGESGDGTGL
jgi:hypothetical protein